MDKKLQASCRHDIMIQERKPNGISASLSKCSPRPQGSGLKRNSLSKSLHNFFHRRHTYSLKQRHMKKGKKLFESINDADGNVEYKPLRRSSKARVWCVRNSFSKSPVETVPCELLKMRTHAKVERKNRCSRTCSYAFDVLNTFNGLSPASEENLTVKQSKFQDVLKCMDDQTNAKIQSNIADHNDSVGSFDETQDRSRLSSFGSSVCYSDTSGCSVSSCSYCNQERSENDSTTAETDISTSYWDLRLPTEASSFRQPGLYPRRYSLSVLSEQQDVFGSPEMRMYLAKRRSSEYPFLYSELNRSNQYKSWQDKFLHVLNTEKHSSERDYDFSAAVNEGDSNDKDRNTKGIDIPRVREISRERRSMSMFGEIRRSKSINRTHRSEKEKCEDKRHLQRSKSVDSSLKRSLSLKEKQTSGNAWSCQFAFSDIDSSEESESSPDPKESSSEDRQPSSCNETSSLSACSISGSSVNERSTPKMITRKNVKSQRSYIEDELLSDTDNIDMVNIDLAENPHLSSSKKNVEKTTTCKQTFKKETICDVDACAKGVKGLGSKVHEEIKEYIHEEQEEIKELINEEQKVKESQNAVQERVLKNEVQKRMKQCQKMLQEDECQNEVQGAEDCQNEVQEVEEFQNMLQEDEKFQNEVQGVEVCQIKVQEGVGNHQYVLHEENEQCKNEVKEDEECQNEIQGVEKCQNVLHEDKNCQKEVKENKNCHNEEFKECLKEVPKEVEKGKKKENEECKYDVQGTEECTNKTQEAEEYRNKAQNVEECWKKAQECTDKVNQAEECSSILQDEDDECSYEGKECNYDLQEIQEFAHEIHPKNLACPSDNQKAECSRKFAAWKEEKFEKIEGFTTDNSVDVIDKNNSFQSNTDVVEVSLDIRSIFSENTENRSFNVFAEDILQYDNLGTDVDTFFQISDEHEDLCLNLLFPEKDVIASEPVRAEQKYTKHGRCDDVRLTETNVCSDMESTHYKGIPDSTNFCYNDQSKNIKMEHVLNCFDSLLHDEPEIEKGHLKCDTSIENMSSHAEETSQSADGSTGDENAEETQQDDTASSKYNNTEPYEIISNSVQTGCEPEIEKGRLKCDTSFENKSSHAEETLKSADRNIEDENAEEIQQDDTASSKYNNTEPYKIISNSVQNGCAAAGLKKIDEEKKTDLVDDSNEKDKVLEMLNESVGNSDEQNNCSEFGKKLLKEILATSGKKESSSDVVDIVDDVEDVFEAMNKEIDKEENKDKDMMVVFIVGGELKVIRRSGTLFSGSHGDSRQTDIPSMTRKERPKENGSRDYVFTRSVHDINRGRPKSAIIVTRSQSFNGMANQQVMMGGRRENPHAIVLGESFRHHRGGPPMQAPRASPGSRGAVGFSFKKSPKVPKVPRPNRALLMFQSVKRGVREFIEATKEDIDQLQHRETDHTSTAQGKLHETDKQIKSAERYLKRLEFHLAKLDELHEYYLLQQQLREGVRTMHRAYVTSPGNQAHSLTNVKYGYKECTQTMCNIEAQLEAMMGTFNCKLKGMAGFARLCPGDVFEVTVRHGTQKWKTKGRIEKTGNQKWDIPEFNFKAVVGDIFNIKGLEVRAFKSVLLGQKSCETKDLFSANPQLMTVSINVNGSLKLSIVITWNPLDGVEESYNFMETTPQRAQGTPRRRPVSVIALNGQYDVEPGADRQHAAPLTIQQTKDDNFILRSSPATTHHANVTSYHGLDSPHVSARLSDHMPDAYRQTGPIYSQTSHHAQAGFHSSPAFPVFGESDSDKQLPHPPTQNSAFSNSLPSVMGHLHFPSVAPHAVSNAKEDEENTVLNIEDVLHTLTSALEDYHGQYTELQKLEDLTKFAHKLIRKQFRNSSRSSSISVSIESALEAFDFLDTEEAFEEPRSPTDNMKASFDDMLCSPESTAKTGDSGIESLAQRLSEDTQLGSSLGSSPVPPSTGNEEVDQCLLYHLTYCERLLENLGAFGPLKCREIYALDKLQKQCTIIESLLKLAKSGPNVDLHSVMSSICEDKTMREFWVKCTDQNSLYIQPDRLLNMLEQKFSSVIAERHMIDPVKVCQHVITRVLDIPDYESERGRSWFVLTLHQFMLYFNEEGGLKHIEDVAEEMKLVERLTSGNPDCVIKAILTLRDTLPSSPCLKVIGMLLVTMDKEVEQCTISYLNLIQKKKENREKALITFVEGLEDRTPEIRSGACAALAILEATESLDQLVYLWQSDSSAMVQRCAKEALLALGDEGRKAFEDAQLSKHGFQGLQVHK